MAALLLEGRRVVIRKNIRLMSLPGTPVGQPMGENECGDHSENCGDDGVTDARFMPWRAKRLRSASSWRGRATVEVWNASDKPQTAKMIMGFFRQKGFDVVKIGYDYSQRQNQTLVVDRSGDIRAAQSVAEALSQDGITIPKSSASARAVAARGCHLGYRRQRLSSLPIANGHGKKALDFRKLAKAPPRRPPTTKRRSMSLILDIRKESDVADYMVVAGAQSSTQLRALFDAVEDALMDLGVKPVHRRGPFA